MEEREEKERKEGKNAGERGCVAIAETAEGGQKGGVLGTGWMQGWENREEDGRGEKGNDNQHDI